ncbi:hypothetical protein ACIA49_01235 [Kribbella sp. NPDC051587]|uniref:hypothetical protein n=1 Tax=Kribbella sp. NPDC051587 TaxID=3364119 RepID=UPI00378F0D6B
MSNLDSKLPELMRRATEDLEPESVDLVERSVAQGTRLRQRRGALTGVAAGVAVLATMGVVVGAVQHFDRRADGGALVAGPPIAATPSFNPTPPPAVTPPATVAKGPTLDTLRSLLKTPGRTLSAPESWGGADDGFFGAAYVADEGKGKSQVTVLLQRFKGPASCKDVQGCTKRPDGSTIRTQSMGGEGGGVISNFVEVRRKDGRFVSLTSYNAPSEKDTKPTRTRPILSVQQLTQLADSPKWKFPVKVTEK